MNPTEAQGLPGPTWYVDSSVVLRALLGHSPAAKSWFDQADRNRHRFVGSRLVELEVRRVNRHLGGAKEDADSYLDKFHLAPISDDVVDSAIAITERLSGADALHVATAQHLGASALTVPSQYE